MGENEMWNLFKKEEHITTEEEKPKCEHLSKRIATIDFNLNEEDPYNPFCCYTVYCLDCGRTIYGWGCNIYKTTDLPKWEDIPKDYICLHIYKMYQDYIKNFDIYIDEYNQYREFKGLPRIVKRGMK